MEQISPLRTQPSDGAVARKALGFGPPAEKTHAERAALPTLHERASGILLHPTSLPGPHGSGDLGPAAYRFVDFLDAAAQRWWQTLPVGPPGAGWSPYSSPSAFAGNPMLISLERLAAEGLLGREDLSARAPGSRDRIDFRATSAFRESRLRKAFKAFERDAGAEERRSLEAFRERSRAWLDDYVLFCALGRAHRAKRWTAWPAAVAAREPEALARARDELAHEIDFRVFVEHAFDRQWTALKSYATARGIALIGDVPIFVAHESADVWAHRELFHLGEDGEPVVVAGVPPDLFSKTGQRWGNPLYRWDVLRETGYAWWLDRLGGALDRFDAVRIDHFIGFHRYWEVPGEAKSAREGRFVAGPGAPFFERVRAALGVNRLIAEDLGLVTAEVVALREAFDIPGMRVLHFSFDPDDAASRPHSFTRRTVVYTGTHDNDTSAGWVRSLARGRARGRRTRALVLEYLGSDGRDVSWDMIRMALLTPCDVAIVPIQDLLGLGSEARMNVPGRARGNWAWRLDPRALTKRLAARLREMTETYGRSG